MILIKGLCKGNGCLPKADVVTFASMLKSAERPSSVVEGNNHGAVLLACVCICVFEF